MIIQRYPEDSVKHVPVCRRYKQDFATLSILTPIYGLQRISIHLKSFPFMKEVIHWKCLQCLHNLILIYDFQER